MIISKGEYKMKEMFTNKIMIGFMLFIMGMTYINSVQYQKQNEIMVNDEEIVVINK
jgi:hypothetical protein